MILVRRITADSQLSHLADSTPSPLTIPTENGGQSMQPDKAQVVPSAKPPPTLVVVTEKRQKSSNPNQTTLEINHKPGNANDVPFTRAGSIYDRNYSSMGDSQTGTQAEQQLQPITNATLTGINSTPSRPTDTSNPILIRKPQKRKDMKTLPLSKKQAQAQAAQPMAQQLQQVQTQNQGTMRLLQTALLALRMSRKDSPSSTFLQNIDHAIEAIKGAIESLPVFLSKRAQKRHAQSAFGGKEERQRALTTLNEATKHLDTARQQLENVADQVQSVVAPRGTLPPPALKPRYPQGLTPGKAPTAIPEAGGTKLVRTVDNLGRAKWVRRKAVKMVAPKRVLPWESTQSELQEAAEMENQGLSKRDIVIDDSSFVLPRRQHLVPAIELTDGKVAWSPDSRMHAQVVESFADLTGVDPDEHPNIYTQLYEDAVAKITSMGFYDPAKGTYFRREAVKGCKVRFAKACLSLI